MAKKSAHAGFQGLVGMGQVCIIGIIVGWLRFNKRIVHNANNRSLSPRRNALTKALETPYGPFFFNTGSLQAFHIR